MPTTTATGIDFGINMRVNNASNLIRHWDRVRQEIYSDLYSNNGATVEWLFNPEDVKKGIQKELELATKAKPFRPKGGRLFDYTCQCSFCGKTVKKSKMATITNQKYKIICIKCAINKRYARCDKCKGWFTGDHCSCVDIKRIKPFVEQYNYEPKWIPFKETNDAYLFGIELEIELNGMTIDKTKDVYKKDWLIYKWDGSLSNSGQGGFEIVTMPLGWEWIKKNKSEFNDIFNLAKLGLKSKLTDTCGMHVHLNKDIFSTFHLYKFYTFHYKNPKLLHYMSGRTWENMIRWANLKHANSVYAKKFAKNRNCDERHSAINLRNPASVEIRIFKGTLSADTFWRNIEFVKAACDYTRYALVKNLSDVELFRSYVRENSKEFPHLYEYLCDKVKGEILCAS